LDKSDLCPIEIGIVAACPDILWRDDPRETAHSPGFIDGGDKTFPDNKKR